MWDISDSHGHKWQTLLPETTYMTEIAEAHQMTFSATSTGKRIEGAINVTPGTLVVLIDADGAHYVNNGEAGTIGAIQCLDH